MRDALDILEDNEEITEVELDKVEVKSQGSTLDISEDYEFVREKLIKSIVRGSELIDTATREAKTTPSARAVESASGAVKVLTEVSKSLIDLHEKIRKIEQERYASASSENGEIQDDAGIVLKSTLSQLLEQIEEEENN